MEEFLIYICELCEVIQSILAVRKTPSIQYLKLFFFQKGGCAVKAVINTVCVAHSPCQNLYGWLLSCNHTVCIMSRGLHGGRTLLHRPN